MTDEKYNNGFLRKTILRYGLALGVSLGSLVAATSDKIKTNLGGLNSIAQAASAQMMQEMLNALTPAEYVSKWYPAEGNVYLSPTETTHLADSGVMDDLAEILALYYPPGKDALISDWQKITDGNPANPGEIPQYYDPFTFLRDDKIVIVEYKVPGQENPLMWGYGPLADDQVNSLDGLLASSGQFLETEVGQYPENYSGLDSDFDPTWDEKGPPPEPYTPTPTETATPTDTYTPTLTDTVTATTTDTPKPPTNTPVPPTATPSPTALPSFFLYLPILYRNWQFSGDELYISHLQKRYTNH